jgi:pyruvate/2-oxoglutarate dehydrogenase complex dihydrolipoamide dehydrogenase (E3) component
MPPISGVESCEPWDNRDITAITEIPERMLIIGGGVVGVEMAQTMKDLGSKEVTIVELQDRLLPTEEPFAGEYGIKIVTGVGIRSFERSESREVTAYLQDGQELIGDEILLALRRRPNTADIGLESIGLEPGQTV